MLIRGMSTSTAAESAIKHVTVIGGGLMGSGIAQVRHILANANCIVTQIFANHCCDCTHKIPYEFGLGCGHSWLQCNNC